jgi:hypothetical protein
MTLTVPSDLPERVRYAATDEQGFRLYLSPDEWAAIQAVWPGPPSTYSFLGGWPGVPPAAPTFHGLAVHVDAARAERQARAARGGPFADLPGVTTTWSDRSDPDGWPSGTRCAYVQQRLGTHYLAGIATLPTEMVDEISDPGLLAQIVEACLEHIFRPWRYPDPNPMPHLVLFPRLRRLGL